MLACGPTIHDSIHCGSTLPMLLHTGTTIVAQAPLEYTFPRHLDDVAIRFPEVKMIMAHLGHPYEHECVAIIRNTRMSSLTSVLCTLVLFSFTTA